MAGLRSWWLLVAILLIVAIGAGYNVLLNRADEANVVVCYSTHDEEFSRPILEDFEMATGIKVVKKFDTEATKAVGLTNSLLAEKGKPVCDVFWNNEVLNMIRLKHAGMLKQYRPAGAVNFPATFKDPDGTWTGFAARARVLLVNDNLVPVRERPRRMVDLLDSKWKGRIGAAKPFFGSTATQFAIHYGQMKAGNPEQFNVFLRILKEQDVKFYDGNKPSAEAVGNGAVAVAFTDTDDAFVEKELGRPVSVVFFDGGNDCSGAVFFPNTVALVDGCRHEDNAKKLIDYLISREVEIKLAKGDAAQIPVNPEITMQLRVETPRTIKAMAIDWENSAAVFDEAIKYAKEQVRVKTE